MSYKEWKSIAEEKPIENCGLLLKIEPKDSYDEYLDSVKYRFFYGYRMNDCDYIYIFAEIYNNKVIQMGWKAHKEFDLDEIYWNYNYQFSNEADFNKKDNK